MLKEAEWMTINNILLELYAQKSIGDLSTKLMRVLRMLIPYTKGYLLLLDADGTIRTDESCFIGMEERESAAYVERYYQEDYLQYLYELSEGSVLAVFNLFRSKELGDFTDKDMEILNILKRHVENMIVSVTQMDERSQLVERCFEKTSERYALTQREDEVMRLLARGLSNSEICDRLTVSISTVKKHIYNLFTKTNVKSRTQLMNLLYQQ